MLSKTNLKNIKLVVFDLDGTLLDNNGRIGNASVELIKKLKQLGVRFSIATQRVPSSVWDYSEALGLKLPLVLLNGTLIQSYPDKLLYFNRFFLKKLCANPLSMRTNFF